MSQEGITLKLGQVCVGKKSIRCRRLPYNTSNQKMHWAARLQWTKVWKEEVGWAFMTQRHKFWKLPLPYAHIKINLYTTHFKDYDGAYTSIKPLLDALKVNGGVGVIIDDSPKYIDLDVDQIKVAHRIDEHVEIIIK